MSAVQARAARAAIPSLAVRARDVLASEWIKFRSVRSTYWTLLIAAVTGAGGSGVVAFSMAHARGGAPPFDPVAMIFVGWLEYPVLAVGILGVLAFTSEYGSGQIRTTFTAVPRRPAVLAAKVAVAGAVTLAFGEFLSFAAFLLSQAIRSGDRQALSLSAPGALRAVLAAGFCLSLIAVGGLGLGAIIRHTAGAVVALPAVLYLPLVVLSLPQPWGERIGRFTLLAAAGQLVSAHPRPGLLPEPLSLLVAVAWPLAALLAAAVLLTRRDA
ncbi:MAG: ABC transporter permease [Streptosporangiaceae bacterium]|nr:ABC transporter permease [Streptosporangiaceae bacterium]MBV9853646.1 ABC transporter permease [Streptosporangiaceae bacterium]